MVMEILSEVLLLRKIDKINKTLLALIILFFILHPNLANCSIS